MVKHVFFLGIILLLVLFNSLAKNIHCLAINITLSFITTAGFSFDANLNDKYHTLAEFIYFNQSVAVDLLQLRYHIQSDLVLRLGHQRLPFHLHPENIQVRALLSWIAAPREVYGRVPINAFTRISVKEKVGDNFGPYLYAGDLKDQFVNPDVGYSTSRSNLIGARVLCV